MDFCIKSIFQELPAFPTFYSNIGDYKAWGHEITLQSRNLVGDFKWTTNLNIAFNRNEITKMGTNNTPKGGYSNQERFQPFKQ